MSQDKQNTSEEFVDQSLNKARKTYRNWLRATVVILALEITYFGVLNYLYSDYIDFVPDIVDVAADRIDLDENLKRAKEFPNSPAFSNNLQLVNKVLDDVIKAKATYSKEIQIVENTLDKVNETPDPEGIADLITSHLMSELDWYGYLVATFTRDYVTEQLKDVPTMTRTQIPKYGARLRFDVNQWIENFCSATSEGFGETFDAFLDKHADEIAKFSETADDTATLDQLDEEFIEAMANFLSTTSIERYGTLQDQSSNFLNRLRAANNLLEPLVEKKTEELTAKERRLRRAVGLFMHLVHNPPAELQPEKN